MTVEFSNTSAAIWNGIQTALQRAGFIIANVAALGQTSKVVLKQSPQPLL